MERLAEGEKHFKWKDWLKEKNISIDNERGDEGGAGIYFHDLDGYTIEIYYMKQ